MWLVRRSLVDLSLALALFGSTGCLRDTVGYCESHDQCAENEFCRLPAHACVEGTRPPTQPLCQAHTDCGANQLCISTKCQDAIARAELSGNQQLPPTCSLGEGSLLLSLDQTSTQLHYALKHSLPDAVAIHVHEGRPGTAGRVVFTLQTDPNVTATLPVGADQITQVSDGSLYVDVHTKGFPEGEVRGQVFSLVKPSPPVELFAVLSGLQEVPPNTAKTQGRALLTYDDSTGEASYSAVHTIQTAQNPITGIHLHRGAIHFAGPHILDYDPVQTPMSAGKLGRPAVYKAETATYGVTIQSGLSYFNFHTMDRTGGELRGQLLRFRKGTDGQPVAYAIPFNVAMEGAQIAPVKVQTAASGMVQFFLSEDQTKLTFRLTHTVTQVMTAHVHKGLVGAVGGVVCTLSTGLDKAQGSCDVKAAGGATDLLLSDLLNPAGGVYVDIHSVMFPNGEIRGQVVVPQPPKL